MYHYNKETATLKVNAELENFRRCINLIDEIKKLVGKFDGKVINKKFTTFLREETGGIISVDTNNYGRFEIMAYAGYNGNGNGKFPVRTRENYYQLLFHAYAGGEFSTNRYIDKNNSWEVTTKTDSGNYRLIAENLIKALDKTREYYEEKIAENQDALKRVDEYAGKLKEIERLEKELNDIPYVVRDYFDLGGYFRRN